MNPKQMFFAVLIASLFIVNVVVLEKAIVQLTRVSDQLFAMHIVLLHWDTGKECNNDCDFLGQGREP